MRTIYHARHREMPKGYMAQFSRENTIFFSIDTHLLVSVILFFVLGIVLAGGGISIFYMSVKGWNADTELIEKIMVPIISALLILWGSVYIAGLVTAMHRQHKKNKGELTFGLYFGTDALMIKKSRDDIAVINKRDIIEVNHRINKSHASIGKYVSIDIYIKDEDQTSLFTFENADFDSPPTGYFSDVIKTWIDEDFEAFKQRY